MTRSVVISTAVHLCFRRPPAINLDIKHYVRTVATICFICPAALSQGVALANPARVPVILISIDTLRADHLSAYGYRKIATPNIDALLQNGGTKFSNVSCQIPLTLPSHTSLFTSTYPSENGIEENAQHVSSGVVTLASVLRGYGYQTAAFIGSVFLEKEMGLDQGFDVYDSPFDFEAFSPISGEVFLGRAAKNQYAARESRDGALVVAAAGQWLAKHNGQPSFVFLHLFDMHQPYSQPASVARKRGISRYDAQLLYVDRLLGTFHQAIVEDRIWDKSLVVLLADHGESLGDHGEANHGYFIYQSTLWVPLLVHWPTPSGQHLPAVTEPAGLIDVAPTILDFLHIAAPRTFHGRSLLGDASGHLPSAPHEVYSESLHAHHSFGWAPLRSLRIGSYKYIQAPRPELYNLQNDPGELNNIVNKDAPQALLLQTELKKVLLRYPSTGAVQHSSISPQTETLLRSLGYLSSGPPVQAESSGADPKDRLAEFREYNLASEAAADGHRDRAISILSGLVARDPHNILALRDIGAYSLDRKSYARARSSFQRFLAIAPNDYMGRFELGVADERLGRFKEAENELQRACRIAPEATQCTHELDLVRRAVRGTHD
jgi:arylsulfatase A-like enzyme